MSGTKVKVQGSEFITPHMIKNTLRRNSLQIPTWHFNGLDYPYYEEVMGGGTPCDLMNGEPRVTRVMFICDREAPLIGMVSVCNAV